MKDVISWNIVVFATFFPYLRNLLMTETNSILIPPLPRPPGMTAHAFKMKLSDNPAESGTDIITDQFITLMKLRLQDELCQHEITNISGCDKTRTTRILTIFEKKILIVRVNNYNDRRHKTIYLTTRGRAACRRLEPMEQAIHEEALTGLTDGQIEKCRKVLNQTINNLNRGQYKMTFSRTNRITFRPGYNQNHEVSQ